MIREIWAGPIAATEGAPREDAVLVNVHTPDKCAGRHCVLHNPSEHHMRSWPVLWRSDLRMMVRTCPHQIDHPDPDDLAYRRNQLGAQHAGVHICDGCCCP